MATPRNGKSNTSKPYPKLSTESVVATSTPIRSNFVHEDIDLSSNVTATNSIEEHSNISEDVPTVTDVNDLSSASSSSSNVSREEIKLRKRRVANVGRDWNHFKPRDSKSLYHCVLFETGFTKDLAKHWLNFWKENASDCTAFMLQFFLDVAGFQNYNIMDIYGTSQFNKQNILKALEDNCPLLLLDYTYLLSTNSEWSKSAKEKIYLFLQEVIICADKKQECSFSMFNELFKFMKIVSHSKIRALKHTSVVFALQFLISLSKLHANCKNELEGYSKNQNLATIDIKNMKNLQMKQDTLKKFLMCAFGVVSDSYHYQETELKDMRRECLSCLYKVVHHNPNFFFEVNAIDIVTNLLSDSSGEIRAASLNVLKKLLKSKKFYQYLQRKTDIFPQIYSGRLDVDYTVAIAAVDVFTASLKLYRKHLSKTILNSIFLMVYNKSYPLASAAGRFLYMYISQVDDETDKIKKIINFSRMPNMEHLLPLLVEALMDCASELHSYKTILRLLLTDIELSFEDRLKLLQILCEIVIQTITGRATLLRTKHRNGTINKEDNEIIAKLIFTKTADLLEIYFDETNCVASILEMLLAFSYQDGSTSQYRTNILRIMEMLAQYFIDMNDSKILDMISKLLFKICDDYCPLKASGVATVQIIFKDCEDRYKQFLNEDVVAQPSLEKVLLQLQNLFKYHNIPMIFNVKNVEELFGSVTKLNENVLSYNLLCGFYCNVQTFRSAVQEILLDTEGPEQNFEQLKLKCNTFIETYFNYIRVNKSRVIAETACECICDFYIAIVDEVYQHKSTYPAIISLKTVKLSTEQKQLLLKFFNKYIFDASVPETKGKKLLVKFSNCIMKSALPIYLLPDIFIHYNSFYDKYGELFNHTLKEVAVLDANVIGVVVSTTIILEFQKLTERPEENIRDDSIFIKKLALQFGKFLSKQALVTSLQYAIDFALEEQKNLMLFHYLSHFCQKLPRDSKSFMLTYITEAANYDGFQGNRYVIEFLRFLQANPRLKTNTTQGRSRRRQSTSTTMATGSNVSYQSTGESEAMDTE